MRLRKVINHYTMAKHIHITITDEAFTFTRNHDAITAEAELDGIYCPARSGAAPTVKATR